MALHQHPLFQFSGTIAGLTFVRTKKGYYVRRARGTVKPAYCNESLENVHRRNAIVNSAAKLVHEPIHFIARDFVQPGLWQVILGRIRTAASDNLAALLKTVEGLEAHHRYPLKQVALVTVDVVAENEVMSVTLRSHHAPHFRRAAREYIYTIIVVLINGRREIVGLEQLDSGWTPASRETLTCEFGLSIPGDAKYFVAMLMINGGADGSMIGDKRLMALSVMKTGSVFRGH